MVQRAAYGMAMSASNAGYDGVATAEESDVDAGGVGERLDARTAFAVGDIEASKAFHDRARPTLEGGHEVHQHPCLGNAYVQEFVAAFLGGASIGTVVAAAGHGAELEHGAAQSVASVTALGCACMHAAAAYLQRRSEQDYLWREFRRETWEWENYPVGEKKEMVRECRSLAPVVVWSPCRRCVERWRLSRAGAARACRWSCMKVKGSPTRTPRP